MLTCEARNQFYKGLLQALKVVLRMDTSWSSFSSLHDCAMPTHVYLHVHSVSGQSRSAAEFGSKSKRPTIGITDLLVFTTVTAPLDDCSYLCLF
jgi:hypothetical protein